uniref:UPAR/Ly6 domain-containing protein n=1 Tax=Daphnia galeata TaxID=27404 RepID=A0A8J2S3F8_9CRUS|nr:unnamed protein product [Daphnia galeata]
MVLISKINQVFLIPILCVFLISRTNALNCYFCSSSSSIYNEDCQNGTPALRFGSCRSGYNYCIARYIEYADGSSNILRDCSISNEMPLFNATLSTGFQFHCDSNLCNSGYIGPASTPSTVPAEEFPNTFNPSSSASRGVLSWFHWSFGVAFYCLSSFIFFLDAYPNVLYHL